jgi:membrane peptidoglycan carboxypeptidase
MALPLRDHVDDNPYPAPMASLRLEAVIAAARRLLLVIGVSGLAGVLVAGLVLPVAAALGLTARESATAFSDLPAELDVKPLAEQSRVVDATGATIATFYDQNRIYVTLDKIAPVMQQAILAIEDHRFYEHGPIDFQGTARALLGNLDAGDLTCGDGCTAGGGSTLTQQYVKLVLQDQAETPEERRAVTTSTGADGYVRKLRELRLAANIENQLTKDQILERYLNIAYFGGGGGSGGAYGIEAAARYFFSTSAAKLTLTQAALLAGLVQAPSEYDPTDNPEKAIGRRNQVLSSMGDQGKITQPEASQARLTDVGLKLNPTRAGCVSTWAPFFCDYVKHEIDLMEELGATPEERERNLLRGGLTITTTLDPKAQRAAQEAVSDRVAPTDSAVGSLAMVEPGTGYIRAIANSRGYGQEKGQSYINYAVDKSMGTAGGSNGIQAGSAFKPWVLAAAIRQGISLSTSINAPQELRGLGGDRVAICDVMGNTRYTIPDDYEPKNSTGSGTFNLRTGTERSVNTFYVQLLQRTGICEPATIAQESGIWLQLPPAELERRIRVGQLPANIDPARIPLDQVISFTLGSNTVSPLAMAEGYAMFAARGMHCDSMAVLQVLDRDDKVIADRKPTCNRVLAKGIADGVNDVLRGVIHNDGATGTRMRLDDGRAAAGKTGTTNQSVAVWFAGYTPQLATAVAVADLDGEQTTLDGRTYNGERIGSACGGCIPGPIWKEAMDAALDGARKAKFTKPDPSVVKGVNERVPDVRGLTEAAATDRLADVGFTARVSGEVASAIAQGLVVETDPATGSNVASGSSVGLILSTGQAPPPEPPPGQPDPPGQRDPQDQPDDPQDPPPT